MNFSCHLYDVSVWRIFSSRWYHPSPTFWVGCRKSFGNRGRLRSFLLTILYTKMMKMRMIAIWFFDEMLGDTVAESSKWQKKTNPYRSMDYIAATSNIVERLFSRCGVIMRPHRCLMDPSTIEMLITSNGPDYPRYIMLIMPRFNKALWDTREVDIAMKRTYSLAMYRIHLFLNHLLIS